MSNRETHRQDTQHAFLVAWGWFAEHIGLIQQLQAVSLKQKHYLAWQLIPSTRSCRCCARKASGCAWMGT